jgi:hypothetical protein
MDGRTDGQTDVDRYSVSENRRLHELIGYVDSDSLQVRTIMNSSPKIICSLFEPQRIKQSSLKLFKKLKVFSVNKYGMNNRKTVGQKTRI